MANRRFNQFFNTLHKKPVLLDFNFTVDSTNGAGISGLVGPGVQNVWMHSSSPSASNPNPASGYALIKLQDNYKRLFGFDYSIQSPNSGSDISISGGGVLTVGQPYIITTVGTSTAANWQAVGLPAGITPAVGVVFIATVTGGGTGTGKVQIPKAAGSGIMNIDIIGDPNTTLLNTGAQVFGSAAGAYLMVRFNNSTFTGESYTPAGTNSAPALTMDSYTPAGTNANDGPPETFTGTPAVLTGTVAAPVFTGAAHTLAGTNATAAVAPTNGTKVFMSLYLTDSNILNNGE